MLIIHWFRLGSYLKLLNQVYTILVKNLYRRMLVFFCLCRPESEKYSRYSQQEYCKVQRCSNPLSISSKMYDPRQVSNSWPQNIAVNTCNCHNDFSPMHMYLKSTRQHNFIVVQEKIALILKMVVNSNWVVSPVTLDIIIVLHWRRRELCFDSWWDHNVFGFSV